MLGFLGAPGVVELEALIAEAGLALCAALGGLQLRGLAELAHDGRADVDGLPVALHHPLQGQVAEEAAQTPLPRSTSRWQAGHGKLMVWGCTAPRLRPG